MTHNTGRNTINKVHVTITFWIAQGVWWGVGFWYILFRWPMTLPALDRLASDRTMLEAKKILNRSVAVVSCIIGTRSKNRVLGGDKLNFITIFSGEGASPFPRHHPLGKINKFKQSALSVNKYEIIAKHWPCAYGWPCV